MTQSGQTGRTFVGREREMAGLRAAMDDAIKGHGRVVMLAGEPGIGKTRMAQELASYAQEHGSQVLWGWCYEGEGAPSYWPWVDSLRTHFQGAEPQLLRDQLGSGAAPIAELIPEILAIYDGLESAPTMEPDQARFRLFDSITGFFKRASEDSPVLLVLDDLHWADQPSLLLLEFVARQVDSSRFMIVGTYRDSEAPPESLLGQSLGRLARLKSFQRQQITGLSSEDVGSFVRGETGITPPGQILNAIHAHTEGNPFFLGEVARYLAELGRLDETLDRSGDVEHVGALGIPPNVRDVIGQRLKRLTEPCIRALTTASVIGREFELGLLEALTEPAGVEELLDLLDEAISARIIEVLPVGAGRYQFRHALMQQTLTENIPSGRKMRLHASIGEALEKAYGDDLRNHAAELAHHFTQAVPVVGDEQMLRYTLMAGERALATYAHEEAVAHFTRGLEAKDVDPNGQTPAGDAEAAGLLFGLSRAKSALFIFRPGNVKGAVANLRSAFEYHVAAGDNERAVEIAQSPPRIPVGERGGLGDVMETALGIAVTGSSAKGQLLANYGWIAGIEEIDYATSTRSFQEALEIARELGDGLLLQRTLAQAAQVDFYHERFRDAVDKTKQVLSTPAADLDRVSECAARYIYCYCVLCIGEPAGPGELTAFNAATEKLGNRLWLHFAFWMSEYDAKFHGDWASARQFGARGMAVAPGAPTLLATMPLTELETGQFDRAEELFQQLSGSLPVNPVNPIFNFSAAVLVAGITSWITDSPREPALPSTFADIILSSPFALPLFASTTNVGLAFDALARGEIENCQRTYDSLIRLSSHYIFVVVDRLLGQLAHAVGAVSQAVEHFEDALAFSAGAGYRPEYAWTCWGFAAALLERGGDGDRRRAETLLGEALQISVGLSMPPLLLRVENLMSRMGESPTPAPPGGLTQREVDVIRLIAAGRTDQEIADGLVIAVRTVTTHVGNILNKTGAANRAEAASFANQHGLVAPDSDGEG